MFGSLVNGGIVARGSGRFSGSGTFLEGGLKSVVWGTVVLAEVEVHESFLALNPQAISDLRDDATVSVEEVERTGLLVIVMFNESQVALADLEGNLGSTVELSVQALSVQRSVEIVSNNVELIETVPEALGGGDFVDLTETKDVLVFSMSQSGAVNFQQTGLVAGEARFGKELSGLGGGNDVHVVIVSDGSFTSGDVFEGSLEVFLVDFNELGAELDVDGVFLKIFLNELVSNIEILAEGLVGVEDGESVDGGQFTVALVPSPDLGSREEVEGGNFSSVRIRRNAVEGVSVSVVVDPSLMLHVVSFPGRVFSVGENGMVEVREGFFETLDGTQIFFETGGNNQVIIFNSSAVSEDNGVFFGDDLFSTDTIGVSSVGVKGKLGVEDVLSLGGLSLFEDTSQRKLFVGVTIKDDHDLIMILCDLFELSGEDTTDVATKDDNIVLFEVLGGGLALLEETSESSGGLSD